MARRRGGLQSLGPQPRSGAACCVRPLRLERRPETVVGVTSSAGYRQPFGAHLRYFLRDCHRAACCSIPARDLACRDVGGRPPRSTCGWPDHSLAAAGWVKNRPDALGLAPVPRGLAAAGYRPAESFRSGLLLPAESWGRPGPQAGRRPLRVYIHPRRPQTRLAAPAPPLRQRTAARERTPVAGSWGGGAGGRGSTTQCTSVLNTLLVVLFVFRLVSAQPPGICRCAIVGAPALVTLPKPCLSGHVRCPPQGP